MKALQKLPRVGPARVDPASLSREQTGLAMRLDELTVAILRAGLTRDLDDEPLPPRAILAKRVFEGCEALPQELCAYAETVAVLGILTMDQAHLCLKVVWEREGTSALQHPILASMLGLSAAQRQNIESLIEDTYGAAQRFAETLTYRHGVLRNQPGGQLVAERMERETRSSMDFADEQIIQMLTPSQLRMLAQPPGAARGAARRPSKTES
ncbi:MAG TPA: hypothetical protein VG406_10315 [Isosphaeraceae bacterium]|jgi:hypothetical protein|nr:hypothetical protein [Isosphaeraceae bacterium]